MKTMRIANAVNCYSATVDTLGNAELNEWLTGKLYRRKFWAIQEALNGTEYISFAPDNWGINKEGGWGYNPHYATNWWYVTWPNRRMTDRFINRIGRLTRDELIRHPVFLPFEEGWLFTTNAISPAAVAPIRSRILADGIPAMSFAAGANPLGNNAVSGNIDYATCKSTPWPRDEGQWYHSDIKNLAFRFVHRFFEKLVNEETQ